MKRVLRILMFVGVFIGVVAIVDLPIVVAICVKDALWLLLYIPIIVAVIAVQLICYLSAEIISEIEKHEKKIN